MFAAWSDDITFLEITTLFFFYQLGRPEIRYQPNFANTNIIIHASRKFTHVSIFSCFQPNSLKHSLYRVIISYCEPNFLKLNKMQMIIYSVLWKIKQGQFPSRIYISQKNSPSTPDKMIKSTKLPFMWKDISCWLYICGFYGVFNGCLDW